MSPAPVNFINSYWRQKFGQRIQRVCLDVGLTCPNRDGTKGVGGCTFCRNDSFGAANHMRGLSISGQLEAGIEKVKKRYKAKSFLAYFQSYTNTYASLDTLKKFYLEALAHPDVIGLAIGTRPDCLADELLDFLQELSYQKEIYLELGIESLNEQTLIDINRGHTVKDFLTSLDRCHKRNLKVGAHLIIGLPGDNQNDWQKWGAILASLPLHSIKFHNLLVLKETIMGSQYKKSPFKVLGEQEYMKILAEILEHLPAHLYIDRLLAEAPSEFLIMPEKTSSSSEFKNRLLTYMTENEMFQGKRAANI